MKRKLYKQSYYLKKDLCDFGLEIRRLRELCGYTKLKLAKSLQGKVTELYIDRLEKGFLMPSIEKCIELAFLLDQDIGSIYLLSEKIRIMKFAKGLRERYNDILSGKVY